MPTPIDDFFFRFYVMGLYGTSTYEVVSYIVGSIAKLFLRRGTWSYLGIIEMARHLLSLTFLDAAKSVQCLVPLIRVLEQTSAAWRHTRRKTHRSISSKTSIPSMSHTKKTLKDWRLIVSANVLDGSGSFCRSSFDLRKDDDSKLPGMP